MDCLSYSKSTCPQDSTVSSTRESAVGTMRKSPILLENNCIYVNCPLPPYGWNKASPQHVNVQLRVYCNCLSVIVFKKIEIKDTIFFLLHKPMLQL